MDIRVEGNSMWTLPLNLGQSFPQQKIYLERSKNFIYGVTDPVDSKSEALFSIALTVLEI